MKDKLTNILKEGIKQSKERIALIENESKRLNSFKQTETKQCDIHVVVVPKGTVCGYCNDTGWDSYPNHDTTQRPCPDCQP
jgi:hypothetical protein